MQFLLDGDGDKISIFNEEDLRTFMELKGAKIFVEVNDGSNVSEKKINVEKVPPYIRAPISRSCRRPGQERGLIIGDGHYRPQNGQDMNGNNSYPNIRPAENPSNLLHQGVQCDGCDASIRGYRYKCIECPDFDLCFSCEMKKLHGEHMMIRIVKPLDVSIRTNSKLERYDIYITFQRPFSRHALKAMLKQRCSLREACEGKEKDKKSRHRQDNPLNVFDDIMTDITKNISTHCAAQAANVINNAKETVEDKSNESNAKQFALNTETFAKAGEVLSNLAQHFASVMDPFAVHEFIATTQENSKEAKPNTAQPEEKKADESRKVTEQKQQKTSDLQTKTMPSAAFIPPTSSIPITPIVPATLSASAAVDSSNQQVTIEDLIEEPSANIAEARDSSPIPDWALVDANGHVEGDQPKDTGSIPKTVSPQVQTPSNVPPLPNYAVLARDLEEHLHHTLESQAPQAAPPMQWQGAPPMASAPWQGMEIPIYHHPSKLVNLL